MHLHPNVGMLCPYDSLLKESPLAPDLSGNFVRAQIFGRNQIQCSKVFVASLCTRVSLMRKRANAHSS